MIIKTQFLNFCNFYKLRMNFHKIIFCTYISVRTFLNFNFHTIYAYNDAQNTQFLNFYNFHKLLHYNFHKIIFLIYFLTCVANIFEIIWFQSPIIHQYLTRFVLCLKYSKFHKYIYENYLWPLFIYSSQQIRESSSIVSK